MNSLLHMNNIERYCEQRSNASKAIHSERAERSIWSNGFLAMSDFESNTIILTNINFELCYRV